MKCSRIAVVLCWLLATTTAACAFAETYPTCTVTGVSHADVLNVRDAPAADAKKVGSIPSNGVHILRLGPVQKSGSSDWSQIQHESVKGWVNSRYLACPLDPSTAQEIISPLADTIIAALSDKDMQTVSAHVHPSRGVRFSPYAYVDTETDVILRKEDIGHALEDETIRNWGYADGSGDPLDLTFSDYLATFVYDRNFANQDAIGYNTIIGSGNTRNNSFEVYPNAIIVEYHYPGTVEHDGMDWASLRLVFEKLEDGWYLVGVIHSQWTI